MKKSYDIAFVAPAVFLEIVQEAENSERWSTSIIIVVVVIMVMVVIIIICIMISLFI